MPNATEKLTAAFNALGDKRSYVDTNRWIQRQYGNLAGVSDSYFYKVRKEWRDNNRNSSTTVQPVVQKEVSTVVNPVTQPVVENVAFADLQKVASLAKELGGRKKLSNLLNLLDLVQLS